MYKVDVNEGDRNVYCIFIISLLILFAVIETAFRKGINSSIIGKYLESNSEVKEDKNHFFQMI